MRKALIIAALCWAGCSTSPQTDTIEDVDGDGFSAAEDCNDLDANIRPDAEELPYDNVDNDCSPFTPDDDLDGDGEPRANDCDDRNASVHPGHAEECDAIDNNCNGEIDELAGETWYADADGDGVGAGGTEIIACRAPAGFVADSGDCNDKDANIGPGRLELCDGVDSDCDGRIDDNPLDGIAWFQDADRDGFGVDGDTIRACTQPEGYADNSRDCLDTRSDVFPDAEERCDDVDNNCDGEIDEGALTYFRDADADGFGDPATGRRACFPLVGHVTLSGDCSDARNDIHPNSDELCDGLDNNCDGDVDEATATDARLWFRDVDRDGFGRAADPQMGCTAPVGFVAESTDCDDDKVWIRPGAQELCDGYDNNCDNIVDEATAVDAPRWFEDVDRDGFGNGNSSTLACAQPAGHVDDATDCDDTNRNIRPGALEICDAVDNDCDSAIDDADAGVDPATFHTFFRDLDGDSWGNANQTQQACAAPVGFVNRAEDCDDGAKLVHPAAQERCNTIDHDCDGDLYAGAEGLDQACPADSCLEVHTVNANAASGFYWISVRGTPEVLTCDMETDGGGWTLVFADDFEGGADDSWFDMTTTTCDGWDTEVLGGEGVAAADDRVVTTDAMGIQHTEIRASLDYLAIGAWDWHAGLVEIDDDRIWTGFFSSTQATEQGCGDATPDQRQSIDASSVNDDDSFRVHIGSSLDTSPDTASFAVDNLEVWVR